MWRQKKITLDQKVRGFHLITSEIQQQLPEIKRLDVGILHLFIQHTSASLTINENADSTVRSDMETHLKKLIPDGAAHYLHTFEGTDDMPAHIKASILGASVSIPIRDGKLQLGTWQGIYLGEHRISGGCRNVIATLSGEEH